MMCPMTPFGEIQLCTSASECLGEGLVCAPNALVTSVAMVPVSSCVEGDGGTTTAEGGANEGGLVDSGDGG